MVRNIPGLLREGASVKVGELVVAEEKCYPGSTPVVFAPDDSCVAWSHGQKRVIILPWNKSKNCLVRDDGQDLWGREVRNSAVMVSAGQEVTAMAFGMGNQVLPANKQRSSWKRCDFSQGLILATGHANGRIRLWSATTGSLHLELMDHKNRVTCLQFAPDSSLRLVSASKDKTLKGWDLTDDGNMFKTMTDCRVPVTKCSWRYDGKAMVACGVSKLVYVYDMVSYKLRRTLEGHHHHVTSCSYSSDGSLILSASLDTRAILWDAHTGAQLRSLLHLDPPPRMIFAAGENGAWVKDATLSGSICLAATVCEDDTVRFWDLWDAALPPVSVSVPRVKEDEMLIYCSFNSQGSVLAAGSSNGNVSFFTVPKRIPSLMHLCRRTVRLLTPAGDLDKLPVPPGIRSYLQYTVGA